MIFKSVASRVAKQEQLVREREQQVELMRQRVRQLERVLRRQKLTWEQAQELHEDRQRHHRLEQELKQVLKLHNELKLELRLEQQQKTVFFKWPHFLSTSKESRVVRPPGMHLLRIAELLVSKKRYERACLPAVADWQEEYFEALDQKRAWPKFMFIRIRYTWAFAKSLLLLGVFAALGKLLKSMIAGK